MDEKNFERYIVLGGRHSMAKAGDKYDERHNIGRVSNIFDERGNELLLKSYLRAN